MVRVSADGCWPLWNLRFLHPRLDQFALRTIDTNLAFIREESRLSFQSMEIAGKVNPISRATFVNEKPTIIYLSNLQRHPPGSSLFVPATCAAPQWRQVWLKPPWAATIE